MAGNHSKTRKRIKRLWGYIRNFGPARGLWVLAKLRLARNGVLRVRLPQDPAPLFCRARTSDVPTFEQVFVAREYELPFLDLKPELIIDAGANVGFGTRFFALKYPGTRILAIEPEASNFDLLIRNTRHCRNVTPIRGALWNRKTSLEIANPRAAKWAFQVQESRAPEEQGLQAVTLPELMGMAGASRVDILKVDIEGAEKELFESDYEAWLGHVGVIIIELHDWFRAGCSASVYRATSRYQFSQFQSGENVVLVNQAMKLRC
ncbi:MAG: FkbM family methyltransferase [Gemmatimonadales bacterium]